MARKQKVVKADKRVIELENQVAELRAEIADLKDDIDDQGREQAEADLDRVEALDTKALAKLKDAAKVYGNVELHKQYHFALGMAVGFARESIAISSE